MDDPRITLEEFTGIVHRAGLRLSPDDVAMLFGEIAASCAVVRQMTGRIRARLAAASEATAEPAHVFSREPGHGAS
ncbi:MAG: hypothetical protein JO255_21350 [Alphaproteobacteria bacterium]|nr:hypothetical protein [Alphaproteobacteria bacterium]